MARPLLICDCDEVLLHFVLPFGDYLAAVHGLDLHVDSFALVGNIRRADGEALPQDAVRALLDGFFDTHMDRQYPAAGAAEALAALSEQADIMILTNIADAHHAVRRRELERHGMCYPIVCNSGPKGPAVAALLADRAPGPVLFVDDLPPQHRSVAQAAPAVYRLHMVADERLRPLVPPAPDAHVRIDDWPTALAHIRGVLDSGWS